MSLRFSRVAFGYSRNRMLFDSLDLTFRRGEFSAVIGPNGSGKSTLLKLASGLLRPVSGQVLLREQDLASMPPRVRARQLAVVFQLVRNVIPYSVQEVVQLGRLAHSRWYAAYREEDRAAVRHAMEELDIARYAASPFCELSGGEQQRVLLAAALAQDPEFLLLDEPTSALDLGHKFRLLDLLKDLARERQIGIVMISHDLGLAARFARRTVLLDHGRIVADGTPEEVITAENMEQCYQCSVTILKGPAGEPVICGG